VQKPTGWGAGGQVVLFVVKVARVELASKSVKHSVTTGLVDHCTLRSAGSRRPALHHIPPAGPFSLVLSDVIESVSTSSLSAVALKTMGL
jgi:hypothetical protein